MGRKNRKGEVGRERNKNIERVRNRDGDGEGGRLKEKTDNRKVRKRRNDID